MQLKEMLKENGVLETLDKIGFDFAKVISGLTEQTDAQYAKYRWFKGGSIVHAIPTEEMLQAGYPWEEWYKDYEGVLQHHILYLEKTDLCDMTFDCPITDTTHPEPTRNRFWYLYNDEDGRLLYTRK